MTKLSHGGFENEYNSIKIDVYSDIYTGGELLRTSSEQQIIFARNSQLYRDSY